MLATLIFIPLLLLILLNLPCGCLRRAAGPLGIIYVVGQAFLTVGGLGEAPCPWMHGITRGIGSAIDVFGFKSSVLAAFPLAADGITRTMLLSIAVVALAGLLVGRGTIADDRQRFNFANLVLVTVMGMNGIVLVRDLFSVYVFIEVASVASFILIALHKDREGLEGALKYIVMSAVATAMMLSAIGLFLMLAGGTAFTDVAQLFGHSATDAEARTMGLAPTLGLLAAALFLGGIFIKSGLVPFHGWLPDAYMAAPAGVSVLLGGIVTKTTGVYVLVRLAWDMLGIHGTVGSTLLLVGTISIVAGALLALVQSDFKRMLAYSSISQVGYIIASLGTGTAMGLAGAVFHIFNHAIFKSQLFVNAAAVEKQVGSRNMDEMGGLAVKMPLTGTTILMALLSTAGVPPFAGFWSKLVILLALWQAGCTTYALIAVLASILTLAYFLSMLRRVFWGKLRKGLEGVHEAAPSLTVPAVILTLITIAVGILIPFVFGTFILPVDRL